MKNDYSIQNSFFGDKYLRESYFRKFEEALKNFSSFEKMKLTKPSGKFKDQILELDL